MNLPTHIGKFEILGELGKGSFGIVYHGRDPDIRRDVAIKVCSVDDDSLRRRFAREGQISGNLRHENIVTTYAAESGDDGVPYLVQELLEGEDLDNLIRRQPHMPARRRLDILRQIARGLAHAHAQGVTHRDIKPANVRILPDGTVKLLDFGIAKLASAETQLTQKGVTLGTAGYLPPEQVRAGEIDHRADIFSYGALAYELLTFERPFRGNTLSALVYQILYKPPMPMATAWPDCPEALETLVARCLEKKPEARFASMEDVAAELDRLAEEADAGRHPALLEGSAADAATAEIPTLSAEPVAPVDESSESSVMSQSVLARAAQEVDKELGAPPPESPPEAPAEITQPFLPPQTDAVPLETISIQPPSTDENAFTQEIATVTAEMSLDEDLDDPTEEMMVSPAETPGLPPEPPPEPPPDLPIPPPPPPAPHADPPGDASPPAKKLISPDAPTVRLPKTPSPSSPEPPTRSSAPKATSEANVRQWKLIALMALGILALGMVVVGALIIVRTLLFPVETGPQPAQSDVSKPSAPPASAVVVTGRVRVDVLPWAELTEITDVDGFVQDLPPERTTPLVLDLPPGRYELHFRRPDQAEIRTCEVVVGAANPAECRFSFWSPADGGMEIPEEDDYFKATGWWR